MLVTAKTPRPVSKVVVRIGPHRPGVGVGPGAGVGDEREVDTRRPGRGRAVRASARAPCGRWPAFRASRRGCSAPAVTLRPLARWASTAATTSPSTPIPAVNTAHRSPQSISPIRRHDAVAALVVGQQVDELVGGLDRVRADAQRAGEDIGRAAGHHRDRGRVRPGSAPGSLRSARPGYAQHPVDHFVHRAVAAVDDDHVDAVAGGVAAISTAWPRWSVWMTVSSTRLSSAWASRSRPAAVVDVAFGFTISTARTDEEPIRPTSTLGVVTVPAPATVRQAAVLVALEGAALVVVALTLIVRHLGGVRTSTWSAGTARPAWFAVMGAAVLAAGWALWTGRRWGRGIAVFANCCCCRWPGTWVSAHTSGSTRFRWRWWRSRRWLLLFSPSDAAVAAALRTPRPAPTTPGPDTR